MFSYLTSFLWATSSTTEVAPSESVDVTIETEETEETGETEETEETEEVVDAVETDSLISMEEVKLIGENQEETSALRTAEEEIAQYLVEKLASDIIVPSIEEPIEQPEHQPEQGITEEQPEQEITEAITHPMLQILSVPSTRICNRCKNLCPESLFMTNKRKNRRHRSQHCRKCHAKLFSWNY